MSKTYPYFSKIRATLLCTHLKKTLNKAYHMDQHSSFLLEQKVTAKSSSLQLKSESLKKVSNKA